MTTKKEKQSELQNTIADGDFLNGCTGWNTLEKIGNLHHVDIDLSKYARTEDHTIKVEPYILINSFTDKDRYESYLEELIDSIKKYLSDSRKKLREMYILYRFDEEDKIRKMNYIKFVFNLIMWRPYFTFGIPITEAAIFSPEMFYDKRYAEYFDKFADKYRDRFTMSEYSESLYWVQVYMNKLVVKIGPLFGNSISVRDMVEMARRNKEVEAIINTQIDLDNFKVSEAEQFLVRQTERLFEILLSEDDKDNPLKPFIRARVGVNKNQVKESYVHTGFKPDFQGDTIPITTNSNLMTEGLKTPESIFVDSKGGRKAAVLQLGVASAGYFGRHSSFATSDSTLNEDPTQSCDTVNLYKVFISSARELELFEGRFRKVGEKEYKIICSQDAHLIGTEIEVRSPATCASKDNRICKACYGTLYQVNYGIHVGLYSAIDANESKTQIGLSARHALDTTSARIELVDDMNFLVGQNSWLFSLSTVIDKKKYELVFNNTDIQMVKEENYDQYDNYFTHRLVFRNIETGERFDVYETSDCYLYLSNQLFKKLSQREFFTTKLGEGDEVTVPLTEINCMEPLVFLRISNKELAAPIRKLGKFLQRGKKPLKGVKDYSEFIKTVNDLFRLGGVAMPSVHIELLIRNLIRDINDDLKLPDWSIKQTPDMYRMTSLNDAILSSSSVLTGLLFEQIKRQLRNPATYRKTKPCMHSLLFVNE